MRIAVITARGGSKRIPKKNIKDFCGKPIIAYSIEAAVESHLFDEVMVSTDSVEIANIAKEYGATVPFLRSEKASNDFATTDDVLEEVLLNYKNIGKQFDMLCCIYPTAPFITSNKLKEAVHALECSEQYSLMPVVRYSYPPQRALVIKEDILLYQHPEFMNARSQDLEPVYHDCGQFYIYKIDNNNKYCAEQFMPYVVSELEVQDIDNEADWKIAELKFQVMRRNMEGK